MLSVLHADGDENVREWLATHLRTHEFRIRSVSGGVACLESLRRARPDCVILDHELPWGGYGGVLALMREDPQLRSIPVFLTSADTSVFHDVAAPISGTLVKPLCIPELIQALRACVLPDDRMLRKMIDHVHRRVHGRVRHLNLTIADGELVMTGRTTTYHVKQLAQIAVMESVALPIRTNAIEVD